MQRGSRMSGASEQLSLPLSMSYAVDSPARTYPARAAARALLAAARACGVSTVASFPNSIPSGSSSRTFSVARRDGSTGSCVSWKSSAMDAYLSHCRRKMSVLLISGDDSSLLPTAVASNGHSNRGGGSGRTGPVRYSLIGLAYRGTLPTLTASAANRGRAALGGNAQGGPSLAQVLLPTLTVAGNYNRKGASPESGDGLVTALREMYPTLCARDAKGPGPAHTRAGSDLPQVVGGHLNVPWLLWFMGFPLDWLEVNDDAEFVRSAMRSSRSVPKSSGG